MKDRADTPGLKEDVINALYAAWLKRPELRLGQLIVNAVQPGPGVFNVEDLELARNVARFAGSPLTAALPAPTETRCQVTGKERCQCLACWPDWPNPPHPRLAHALANPPGPRGDWPVEEPGVLHRLRTEPQGAPCGVRGGPDNGFCVLRQGHDDKHDDGCCLWPQGAPACCHSWRTEGTYRFCWKCGADIDPTTKEVVK